MYRKVKTYNQIKLESGSITKPIISLEDEYGGKAHVVMDDKRYVLVLKHNQNREEVYRPTYWWLPEAIKALNL